MTNRCQVCDGPIVNGRCKYCGMPYRNEEVLYHLNESRSDHYRHATPKAKKIMAQQAVPVADRKETLGRTSSKEEIKAHHQQVREEAVKRMTAAPPKAPQSAKTVKKAGSTGTAGKHKSRVGLIAVTIIVICGALQSAGEWVVERYEEKKAATVRETVYPESQVTEVLQWAFNNGVKEYYLVPENGEVTVGADLDAGVYEASIERGTATVVVYDFEKTRSYDFDAGRGSKVLILQKGSKVYVEAGALAEQVVFSKLSD